jgi:hypothetical protein
VFKVICALLQIAKRKKGASDSFSKIRKELHAVIHLYSQLANPINFGFVAKRYQLALTNDLQKARRLFLKTFRSISA